MINDKIIFFFIQLTITKPKFEMVKLISVQRIHQNDDHQRSSLPRMRRVNVICLTITGEFSGYKADLILHLNTAPEVIEENLAALMVRVEDLLPDEYNP
jgi:predicted protein tyrosine phosphatase